MDKAVERPGESPPSRWSALLQSPIGKKLITGITGLGLALFVVIHMLGNLLLFVGNDAYNRYARTLEHLSPLVYAIDLGLLIFVGFHALMGIRLTLSNRRARPIGYSRYTSAGNPSLQSLSSRSMLFTGSTLALFLVFHLNHFKFGPYYTTVLDGAEARDLARLLVETFHQPLYALGYTTVMILLGLHLRHGLWSALQSLGAMSQGLKPVIYGLSLMGAIAIALGFILLPLTIYFGWIGSL